MGIGKSPDGAINVAADAISDLRNFIELSWSGAGFAQNSERILAVLTRTREETGRRQYSAAEVERFARLEKFASEHCKKDFPYLYGLASLRLWSILESACWDLMKEELLDLSRWKSDERLRKLKGSIVEVSLAASADRTDLMLEGIKRELVARREKGLGGFESALELVGLAGPIAEPVTKLLYELREVRNAVAHRNGFADKRFLQACPWFAALEDELISVAPQRFHQYILAAQWYIVELDLRIRIRDGQSRDDEPPGQNISGLSAELLSAIDDASAVAPSSRACGT